MKPPDDSPAAGDENEEDGRHPEGAQGNERAVDASCAEPPRGVQLSDWDIEQQSASKKNTMAYVANILGGRSTRAMTVVIDDVSLPLEVEFGKTCRYMEFPEVSFVGNWRWRQLAGYTLCMSVWMLQSMGLCDEALECIPLSGPQSRPWRMRWVTSCA